MPAELTYKQWLIGQALANPAICTGKAEEWELRAWFGERGGITRWEIIARQAEEAAAAIVQRRYGG